MSDRRWILVLLALAVVARVLLLGWDSGMLTPHPDERRVAMVAERMAGPLDDPEFFAYGTLHLNLVRATTAVPGLPADYEGLIRGGRLLSVVASFGTLLMGAWLARRAWGTRTAVTFLALALVVPLDLQQSHFATVEAVHAFLVLTALAGSWRAALGSFSGAVLGGAAFGASLGVKISSLPLIVPLAVAVVVTWRRYGARVAATRASAVAMSALTVFFFAQPWTFTDGRPPVVLLVLSVAATGLLLVANHSGGVWRAMLTAGGVVLWLAVVWAMAGVSLNQECVRGVTDQLAMVRGVADVAYVRVYEPTVPLLYSFRELALWGLGPALLAVVVLVSFVATRFVWLRRRGILGGPGDDGSVLVLLLLAWVVPVGLRLATLHVKFLRYWQPLVVPLLLLVGWWLLRLPRRWRRPTVIVVVGLTVVWGLAYLSGLAAPHPHRRATNWLDERLTAGQTVAFEHWDESLPLRTPIERVTLASYILPDDEAKATRWARALADADWVVLTSNRVRRTVVANRDRFPRTAGLYQLLLTGKAGFRPITTFSRGPRLFGAAFPVQLADESFVSYEMPRVVVLRRVRDVDPVLLAARAAQAAAGGVQSFPELERVVDGYPSAPAPATAARQVTDLVVWVLVLSLIAASTWVLLLPVTGKLPDGGLGLAPITGWCALSWFLWFGNRIGLWPADGGTATVLLLVLIAAAVLALPGRRAALQALIANSRPLLLVVGVAATVFLFFLVVRLGNPAVWWGEKPMDLTFLSAFSHTVQWPPGEPWLAGRPLHYYYFGEVLGAVLIKLTGTRVAVGYNLIAATIPALAAAVASSLGVLVRRRWIVGALAAPGVILLSGNVAWPWSMDLVRSGRLFDAWWATSRVIPGFAIDEFPLWTVVFADLHAHLFALPVVLVALGWAWLAQGYDTVRPWPAAVLCGAATGVVLMTNPWDMVVLCTTTGIVALAAATRRWPAVLRLVAAGVVCLVVAGPFFVELGAWFRVGVAGGGVQLNRDGFAPALALLQHFGQFMVPLVVGALWMSRRRWCSMGALVAAGALLGWGIGSPAAVAALAGAGALVAAAWAAPDCRSRLPWLLAGWGLVLVAVCERVTLVDRMNTLFKIYNGVWLLMGLALVIVLVGERGRLGRIVLLSWLPLGLVAAMNLPLGVVQGWVQPRVSSPRSTLDGGAFLERHDPSSAWLVETLAACAAPGDTVAEAAGPPYREYTRISMHTGLPTVVGWEWHLRQRGQRLADIEARENDLRTLYAGANVERRRAVLDRWGVRWVAVGDLERSTYGIVEDDPLSNVPGVRRLANRGADTVYLVRPLRRKGTIAR